MVFRDPEVRFGDLPQIAGRRLGNIGARFLAGTRLTIDARNRRIRIELPGEEPAPGGDVATRPDRLAAFAGSFRVEGRLYTSASEPTRVDGRATWGASADGRRRHERFELDGEDGPLRGEAFLGPVGAGPALELVQIDGFEPEILHVQGAWSADGRTIVLERCGSRTPGAVPVSSPLRCIFRFEEGGVIVKETHVGSETGRFRLASEHRYMPDDGR